MCQSRVLAAGMTGVGGPLRCWKQRAAALLTAYAGAASQHALQLSLCSQPEAQAYDKVLKEAWETLAEDRKLDDAATLRLGLPTKLGGAGVQWATTRRCAAFWAHFIVPSAPPAATRAAMAL